jgi:hypothetical protein
MSLISWVTVNNSLTLSHRIDGTEYRIREHENGTATLFAEGRINERADCRDHRAAMKLAEQWVRR